jgi:uncharacterized protein (TIGR00725 family)
MKQPETIRIAVIGPNVCTDEQAEVGCEVGAGIARRGAILVCGGMGGMMEAAARGAQSAGGRTVGLLPGIDAGEANAYIDVPLPTGIGFFRNMLVVRSCHVVIAVYGRYGTLSELSFALNLGIPVVGLHTWKLVREGKEDPGIHVASAAAEAVEMAWNLATRSGGD